MALRNINDVLKWVDAEYTAVSEQMPFNRDFQKAYLLALQNIKEAVLGECWHHTLSHSMNSIGTGRVTDYIRCLDCGTTIYERKDNELS